MLSIKPLLCLGLLSVTVLAFPASLGSKVLHRQSDGATCGTDSYSIDDINNAVSAGCNLEQSGETVGRNNYPHSENNYEQLDFEVSGPYFEFPIMEDGSIFDGSEGPGADRVVFNDNCELAGVVTHTGAGGNNFLLCDYN